MTSTKPDQKSPAGWPRAGLGAAIGTFEARGWFALTAPVGTAEPLVHKINADLRTAFADAELQRKFASLGTYPIPMSPAETAAFIRGEQDLWRPVVRKVLLAQP